MLLQGFNTFQDVSIYTRNQIIPYFNCFTQVRSVYVISAIQLRGQELLQVNLLSLSNSSPSTQTEVLLPCSRDSHKSLL